MKVYSKIILLLFISTHLLNGQCFLTGADLSYTNEILNKGGVYKNEMGAVVDPFEYFSLRETKIVRLRLWHTPANNIDHCGNTINAGSLADVLEAALKVKTNGMQLKLSIHYSDYFVDPGKQKRPKAWEGITHSALLDSISNYTEHVLTKFYNQNTIPEIVSIGNETTWGFIDETSTTNGFNWEEDRDKFNTALNAIDLFNEEKNTSIKKALHFTESSATWATNLFIENGVNNFDIIGISYYPFFSPNTSIHQVGEVINELIIEHEKEVMVFETGFVWTDEYADNYNNFMSNNGNVVGHPMTAEGQLEFLLELSKTVEENNGIGVIYWEPAWITSDLCDAWGQGSSYENVTMFDFENNQALPSFDFFAFCGDAVKADEPLETKIKIHPNPVISNELIIENVSRSTKWELINTAGKTIKKGVFSNNGKNKIILSDNLIGIYFLKIISKTDKEIIIKKIII